MGCLLLIGCKKSEKPDGEVNTAADFAFTSAEFVKISESVLRSYLVTPFVLRNGSISCDSLSLVAGDTLPGSVRSYTRAAAGSKCGIADNALRSGTIKVSQIGRINAPGNKLIIKISDYTKSLGADSYTFSCDSIVLSEVRQENNQWRYQLTVVNGKGKDAQALMPLAFSATVTLLEREVSLLLSGSGTSRDGKKYTFRQDTDPVYKASDCEHFTVGKVAILPESAAPRYIDFGNGGCDFEADVYYTDLTASNTDMQEINRIRIELK